jgi:cell division protein FtsB
MGFQRIIPTLMLLLLLALHAQLWMGRGSVWHVDQLQRKLEELHIHNKAAQFANEQLAAEVGDLREGLEMIESIARTELGMIKPNEILVQFSR